MHAAAVVRVHCVLVLELYRYSAYIPAYSTVSLAYMLCTMYEFALHCTCTVSVSETLGKHQLYCGTRRFRCLGSIARLDRSIELY